MSKLDWRIRLGRSVEASGRSLRDISLKAGRSPSYVHGILKDDKEPSVDHLAAVCDELGVSLSYILFGTEMSRETEEIIRALEKNPSKRAAILALLAEELPLPS